MVITEQPYRENPRVSGLFVFVLQGVRRVTLLDSYLSGDEVGGGGEIRQPLPSTCLLPHVLENKNRPVQKGNPRGIPVTELCVPNKRLFVLGAQLKKKNKRGKKRK